MKLGKLFSPGLLAIAMSFGVTAGSLYVTVSAASSNSTVQLTEERTATPTSLTASSSVLSSVTIDLSSDGSLNGRFSNIATDSGELDPASDVRVSLISGTGESRDTMSRADGTFSFRDVSPGVYSVHANSAEGRLAFGIRAIRSHDSVAAARSAQPVSLNLQLDFGLAPKRDASSLSRVIQQFRPDEAQRATDSEAVAEGSATDAVETSYEIDVAETSLGHEQLHLTADGSLHGHVTLLNAKTGNIAAVKDLTVSFISDDKLVNETSVNPDGSFVQRNLLPGIYTCVVAGTDGISYLGVDVVSSDSDDFVPTAARQNGFDVGVVEEEIIFDDGTSDDDDDDLGGLFGGGGGGGGLLLPLLIAGGIAAALADDDNGVASPKK